MVGQSRAAWSLVGGVVVGLGVSLAIVSQQSASAVAPFSGADCPVGQDILVAMPEYKLPTPGGDYSQAGAVASARALLADTGVDTTVFTGDTSQVADVDLGGQRVTFHDSKGAAKGDARIVEFAPGMWRAASYSYCGAIK